MKEQLLDIVKVISSLPFEMVRVNGIDGKVTLQSKLNDNTNGTVAFYGKIKANIPEFEGIFGLGNINMLVGITNIEAFQNDTAKITIKRSDRNGVSIPEEIIFENPTFGKASYRLAGEKGIPGQINQTKQIKWDVELDNTVIKSQVTQFMQLAGIYSTQETKFRIKTENGNLKFLIGDENSATHKAQVIFAKDVVGDIKPNFTWSIAGIMKVLNFGTSNDNKMKLKIVNEGFLQIEIDTGIGEYSYIFGGSK